ncbi:MAG: hypothetical protein IT342_25060 [Candidatus Melainabacteria bacterium]|nr:hypothetical protein [Candidatus Melainabacteria bacterium]
MFLSLEFPGGDKHVTFFARDLAGDDGFDLSRHSFSDWDSDRSRADRAVQAANRELGAKPFNYFSMLFNQFTWEGTTGWEYWSRDYDKVLKHALVVAQALALPLHVHNSFDGALLDAAQKAGIELDFVAAVRVANPVTREFEYTNRQLDNGEFIRLVDVVLPEGTPEVGVD